ncbi:ferric reductase-like transmembrane domain-containing protein [Clostridium tarantellae]|uniref:Uncharacterized protein n=1 Tax=Clostridium tarantellae TaxID=39493 RepID=A0A6I1MIG8_9CLOT|nr:ferric reductase-like transmembrane domain-containing protein [Clostridium tarantellae]MPQ43336.1 hypothetical protein [Clostridium tarantellae]
MVLIFSIIFTLLLSILFHKQLRKYSNAIYIATIIISLGFIIFYKMAPHELKGSLIDLILQPMKRGTIALALFTIVMYTGALNKKWKITKILFSIRAQLSIIACILTLGHNILYGTKWFVKLFFDFNSLSGLKLVATIISLILIMIMIPLMVTSFPSVRKKMKFKVWKRIQKLAYVFYGLIYVHILLLYIPKINKGKLMDVLIYGFIMGAYFIFRIIRYYIDKKRKAYIKNSYLVNA